MPFSEQRQKNSDASSPEDPAAKGKTSTNYINIEPFESKALSEEPEKLFEQLQMKYVQDEVATSKIK